MVDPLNTKTNPVEAQPLRALPMPGTMPVPGSPTLPAVDGGELVERMAYRVENPSAWPEGFDQDASDLFRGAVSLITTATQEVKVLREALHKLTALYESDCDPEVTHRPDWLRDALSGEKP